MKTIMNKKELAIETIAQLFTAAFSGQGVLKTPDSCTIERTPVTEGETDPNVRWFKQTFEGLPNLDLSVGISKDAEETMFGRATLESSYEDRALPLRQH